MSSIGSILSSATTAMRAAQVEMQTTSQNIANAGVDGYSVQRVQVVAGTPQHFTFGNVGTGVVVQGVTQARDKLLDAQYRTANGSASNEKTASDTLTRVEQVLGEPSATGLSSQIDLFWNSWSDLAANPTNMSAKGVVKERGVQLAATLNGFATQLDTVTSDTRATVTSDIGQINELAKQVAELSPQIVAAEGNGQSANDLRDTRNRMLDKISSLADTQVIDRPDGSVGVYLGGRMLVDGTAYHQVAMTGGVPMSITFAGSPTLLQNVGGSIGAGVTAINQTIPGVMSDLDTLAGAMVQKVNQIQSAATVFPGGGTVPAAGSNFFNQSATVTGPADPFQTARGISVSASLSDLNLVAASGPGATGPGDNAAATQLAGLRDTAFNLTTSTGNTVTGSIGAFYRYTVSSVAIATSDASSQSTVHQTLATQADTRRQSVSGVVTDEELVNLIKQQQAYSAAARLISVVSDMSKTLMTLGQ